MPNPPDPLRYRNAPPAPDEPLWDHRTIERDNIAAGISLALLLVSGFVVGYVIFLVSAMSSDGCGDDGGLCSVTGQLIVAFSTPMMTLLAWLTFASSYLVRARRGIPAAQVLRWGAWILQVGGWVLSFMLGSSMGNG